MPVFLAYPHHPRVGAPKALTADAIRAAAAKMRRTVIAWQGLAWPLRTDVLAAAAVRLEVKGRVIDRTDR